MSNLSALPVWAGLSINSVRPRITMMQQRGELIDTGVRRPTPAGRRSKVWRVPDPSVPQDELFR